MKISKTEGVANSFPEVLTVQIGEEEREYRQKDDIFFLCYDFASWLEHLPKGAVVGASLSLRSFLRERGYIKDD